MNNQEVFDKVSTWLLREGGTQSSSPDIGCVYRSEDGNMCAIGCILPDELYSTSFETNDVEYMLEDKEVKEYFSGVSEELLHSLQVIHDNDGNWSNLNYMYNDLRSLANEHQLQFNFKGI